ncbi:L-type lectin-domain containing receptor kinase IX.1 [Dichanthelium oligosanthes]|uniref:non-specific serine/threonine protein kinase n=1 Tax=Dichanthelium oligosanthes TaxID=888268 RepID=A0A1E5VTA9_9POAL|nr:L-type lectin-domain containing receptor kinase IX.1 [Dichanthelium oligosanthes]
MAAATSSSPFPLGFLCLYCFFVLCIHAPCAASTSFAFNFSTITQPDPYKELKRRGDSWFANSQIELTTNDRGGTINGSTGWVWYANPVPLWDAATGELASFHSVFSFLITPDGEYKNQDGSYNTGDGMAFFLTSYSDSSVLPSGGGGGNLGLFSESNRFNATGDGRVVAVEFDTFRNPDWDNTSNQHVGIDVNSIRSVNSTDTGFRHNKTLTSDLVMVATVQYDNKTKLLAVDLDIDGATYQVSSTVDLKLSLPEQVAVGFSAATGSSAEMHRVRAWSFNCTLEIASEPSAKLVIKVVVPVLAVSVCVIVCLLLWLWRKPRRSFKPIEATNDSESDEQQCEADFERGVAGPRRYHYCELTAATGDFAEENILGRGGFGSVYKGCLPSDVIADGQLVAIKKFSSESSQSRKEFEAEVKIIGRLRHRNLVQLLGWCDSRKGLLLVYELVPEGSLDKHIYNTQRVLTWTERYNIIVGLGSALRYLHLDWEQCVVHGDIKPSNIMLDSSYNSKLGDFGLARLGDHGSGPKTTVVKGTMGYIDPEFVNTSRRSTQSDVYSFGIVLLEIVSGRPPVDRWDPSFMLMKWVWNLYSEGKALDAADARLRTGDEAAERQMERALVVGLWCTLREPEQRPSVADALHILQSEDKLPDLPLQMYKMAAAPRFAVGEYGASSSSSSSGVRSSATSGTGTTRSFELSSN